MKRLLTAVSVIAAASIALCLLAGARGDDYSLQHWLRGWPGFAHDQLHTSIAPAPAQALVKIHWQTPVDLNPQYSGSFLLAHYGSPLITPRNNVLVTVKVGATGTFRVECHRGSDGTLVYTQTTDYTLPSHNWVPSVGSTLTPLNSLAIPAIGGTVLVRYAADWPGITAVRQAFFGIGNYNAAPSTYDALVKINTPITSDSRGNLYFGFATTGATPANLVSGLARLDVHGNGTWISAANAAGDAAITKVTMNCAPAISSDGQVVYFTVRNTSGKGYLVGLNSLTLAPLYKVRVKDPNTNFDATLSDNGTASPSIGPDGEVYCGVLESPGGSNHSRGWLLHFDSTLTQTLIPGAFGWDTTATIVPSSAVPPYSGSSPYLMCTKYNDYPGGQNKVAVLDPHASQVDPVTGTLVMKEVITKLGPTPDPSNGPNAVREWCINTTAVDIVTKSAMVNNEDGKLYRWDFATNTLSQVVTLTAGLGEAYTPTVVGPDGQVYAINNAILFACGQ
jgi:hypothetical protein